MSITRTSPGRELTEEEMELRETNEKLEGCRNDLIFMRQYEGESPVIDANIRHKREQVKQLEEHRKALEARIGEAQAGV